ncbi:tyrosine-type recombinase/integrase [Mycobacteroides abscessus]|uniref:tyrosine-type recombinase/integrase n=1 Tax=Mycobacteroides abscessus TaxID=36809 RepID=UPI000C25E8B2|nr:tyrosine-type recombinase/integrase [Mycobacteroides abscessus]
MAYIRAHETQQKRKGKPVKRYEVVWREPVTDAFGVPIPGEFRSQQETCYTREEAEARRDEINAAKRTSATSALAKAKEAGEQPFGHYTRLWLAAQQVRVADGKLKQSTLDGYERLLRCYVLDVFGPRAVASIAASDCEEFRALLVSQPSRQGDHKPLTPATRKHVWNVLRWVLAYSMKQHSAIQSNPADATESPSARGTGDHEKFEHHPLRAEQVGQLSAAIAGELPGLPAYPVYALMVEFLAYSGLRAAENTGLEIGDLVFSPGPKCVVKVQRTKKRKDGQWVTNTPKSKKSRRTVPLPDWLAERLAAYLAEHPRRDDPTAPLWPSRKNGGGYRAAGERYAVPLDWSQPLAMGAFYDTIFRPALEAIGLPATRPATEDTPAQSGVRLHDLRHTFAVLLLSAGVHFMLVSKWLGHSTYTLTLDVYGDYIPEEDGGALNTLPEPPAPVKRADGELPSNVVSLFGRQAN